jgi:hypothetical protein
VELDQELAEVRQELRQSPELASVEVPAPHASLSEELAKRAKVSPRAAVLEAFARIEAPLAELLYGTRAERSVRRTDARWPG